MFVNLNTLVPFLEEPSRKFHLREYARLQKISPATAMSYLKVLVREGLVVRRKDRLYALFSGNTDSPAFVQHKVFLTLSHIIASGVLQFLDRELAFPTVILFGSGAKGEDLAGSDLDLFILSNTKKELNLSAYEQKLKKNIQLFVMDDATFKKTVRSSPELANNIVNGIKLSGFLKVF